MSLSLFGTLPGQFCSSAVDVLTFAMLSLAFCLVGSALLLQNASLLLQSTVALCRHHMLFPFGILPILLLWMLLSDWLLRSSSLPLFHYELHLGVLTTLYIQRLSLYRLFS